MTRVLFVVGKGRSGSTLLGQLLEANGSAVHVGELWRLWESLESEQGGCGCRSGFWSCPFWSEVLSVLVKRPTSRWAIESPAQFRQLQRSLLTTRGLLTPSLAARSRGAPHYQSVMWETYQAISQVSGAGLIVDSSKWPLDPYLWNEPSATFVHLVRDPRAVAFSWLRPKEFPDRMESMPKYGPAHSSVSWFARNLMSEMALRHKGPDAGLTVRYEDLANDPTAVLELISDSLHLGPFTATTDRAGLLGQGHTVMGNPVRFATGRPDVVPDERWRAMLPARRQLEVMALTWPLMRRYGYRLSIE